MAMKLRDIRPARLAALMRKRGDRYKTVSRQTVNGWEAMEFATLSGEYLLCAADILGVRPRWLLWDKHPMFTVAPELERKAALST